MIYFIYLLLAACVVFISIKCANYVDLLDKKTNMSGAFIGGVILAAVTSLPELITSISAIVVVDSPGLIIGNVLGSNIFNLAILGALVIFGIKSFINDKVSKSHRITLICTIAVYAILACCIFFNMDYAIGGVSIASVLILIIYLISLKFLASDDSQNDNEDTSPLTIKQIVIRFIIMAVLLVISSVLITYVTDIIAVKLNLGASLAGALFLGIATSLPELSSSVALVRAKNHNAMIGNIVGSNMFNYLILLIGDLMYFKASIYTLTIDKQTMLLTIFGFIASIFTAIILSAKYKNVSSKVLYIICGVLIIGCYLSFLVLSII